MSPSPARIVWGLSLAALCLCAPAARAQDSPAAEPTAKKTPKPHWVKARVRFLTEHLLYLDRGSDAGIHVGDGVRVELTNGLKATLQIEASSRRTSTASLGEEQIAHLIRVGQSLWVKATGEAATAAPQAAPTPTRKKKKKKKKKKKTTTTAQRPSVDDIWKDAELAEGADKNAPLLAPVATAEGSSRRREQDPFHLTGRLTLSALHVKDEDTGNEWQRLRAHGRVILDRLGGTDWRAVLRLSSNVLFEDGDDDPQVRLHELFIEHAPRSGSHVVRAGRFYFDPLPAVGQLDGVHGEVKLGSSPFHVGSAVGLIPLPETEAPDSRRAGWTIYGAYRNLIGDVADVDLTAGYLGTSYKSHLDRSAVISNQRISLFQTVYLTGQQVIDVYDSDDQRSGVRLTQAYVDLSVRANEWLTLGGGYNRNEVPDTYDGNDLYDDLSRLRNTRGQRFYLRGAETLSRGWSLHQRLSFIDRFTDDLQVGIYLGANKAGLLSELDTLRIGFNGLYGGKVDEHSPHLEFTKNIVPGLDLRAAYRLRVIQPLRGDDTFVQHEFGGGGTWIWKSFSVDLLGSYTLGDDVELVRVFASATWWF